MDALVLLAAVGSILVASVEPEAQTSHLPDRVQHPDAEPAALPPLDKLTVDELIDRLPRVEAEGHYDTVAQRYVYHPAVEEMRRQQTAGLKLTDAQWQRALTRTGIISYRSKWPADSSVAFSMRDSSWLGMAEIRLKPRNESLKPITGGTTLWNWCGNGTQWRREAQMYQEIGTLPIGKHHLVFDAEIERGDASRGDGALPAGMVWQGILAFDVEVVPTLQEAMPQVASAEINAAMRRSLGVCVHPWGNGGKAALLVFDADVAAHPDLASTAISATVELRLEGATLSTTQLVVARYDDLLNSNSVYKNNVQLFSFAELRLLPSDSVRDGEQAKHWSIRVTGIDDGALRFWHADRRWAGSIEIPLADAVNQEKDRMAGKPERLFVWMP